MIRQHPLSVPHVLTNSLLRDVIIAALLLSTAVYCGRELWALRASLELIRRNQPSDTANLSRIKQFASPYKLIAARSEYIVLLVISTDCHFCTESMDFYRDLTSQHWGTRLTFVAVCPQTPNECSRYLATHGVVVNQIASASSSEIGVPGTPTILLVDRSLNTLGTWVGRQKRAGEHTIRSELLRLSNGSK